KHPGCNRRANRPSTQTSRYRRRAGSGKTPAAPSTGRAPAGASGPHLRSASTQEPWPQASCRCRRAREQLRSRRTSEQGVHLRPGVRLYCFRTDRFGQLHRRRIQAECSRAG
ncbi:hypothetical protein T310_8459, partial [Rasamsonia emersonii CBS 393.64]